MERHPVFKYYKNQLPIKDEYTVSVDYLDHVLIQIAMVDILCALPSQRPSTLLRTRVELLRESVLDMFGKNTEQQKRKRNMEQLFLKNDD